MPCRQRSFPARMIPVVAGTSLRPGCLAQVRSFRVTFWGALAMALTAGVGTLFGLVV